MSADVFRQLTAGFIGACVGGALAWLLEIENYSPLAIYILFGSWLGAWLVTEDKGGALFDHAKYFRISLKKKSIKILLFALMAVMYFGAGYALELNPRSLAYLPLVPLIIASTLALGFEYGLMATILSAVIADYFYVPVLYSLKVEQWESAIGLVTFVIAGSLLAFGISKIVFSKR